MLWLAKMSEYRKVIDDGIAGVQKMLAAGKCTPDEAEEAFQDYRAIYGIIDSMTPEERENPVERIDGDGIRRIANNVGIADRKVIRFLISYDNYNEMICRAKLGIFE